MWFGFYAGFHLVVELTQLMLRGEASSAFRFIRSWGFDCEVKALAGNLAWVSARTIGMLYLLV